MADRNLEHLRKVFLQAEKEIINEIVRLRSLGLIDYHVVAALKRVQAILKQLEDECWTYVPRMIEEQFYVKYPDLYTRFPKNVTEHLAGYIKAEALSAAQLDVVERLSVSLMSDIMEASDTCMRSLTDMLVGRAIPDEYRRAGLEMVLNVEAKGFRLNAPKKFAEDLMRDGVTAFVDKAGRRWRLWTYGDMVLRTTSRQANTLASLMQEPEHDLYKISSHGTTCGKCAPFEGRVYSKSGKDPIYPPLADAFGKIDPAGPNDLTNTWLNIHPNCLHVIYPWSPDGRSEEEIKAIQAFSSPKTNPYSRDPRSEAQIAAYRKKEAGRARFLADYRQWEKYRIAMPDKVPKTFQTFQKHKMADDEKYKSWVDDFKNLDK